MKTNVCPLSVTTLAPFTKLANQKPASHANTKHKQKMNQNEFRKHNFLSLTDSHDKMAIFFADKDQVCNANTLLF